MHHIALGSFLLIYNGAKNNTNIVFIVCQIGKGRVVRVIGGGRSGGNVTIHPEPVQINVVLTLHDIIRGALTCCVLKISSSLY